MTLLLSKASCISLDKKLELIQPYFSHTLRVNFHGLPNLNNIRPRHELTSLERCKIKKSVRMDTMRHFHVESSEKLQ